MLASDVLSRGTNQIMIGWSSVDDWEAGHETLFYSPVKLGLECKSLNEIDAPDASEYLHRLGKHVERELQWVHLEDICWILEPETCYEKINGINWKDVKPRLTSRENDLIKMRKELVSFFFFGMKKEDFKNTYDFFFFFFDLGNLL